MMKILVIWASIFLCLCLSSSPSKVILNNYQFALKSQNENTLQGHFYQPLKIHSKVIEESFSEDGILEVLNSKLIASTKLISDLLLTEPSTDKIRLGENNQCSDILLSQIIQKEDIDADIAIFVVSNKDKGEIVAAKICEVNENKFIKAIALEINAEEFKKLKENLQVKELSTAIANILYEENDKAKQALIMEINTFLAESLSACPPPCSSCSTSGTICTSCDFGYFLNGSACTACIAPCSTCSTSGTTCTSCISGYFLNGNTCTPCIAPCSTCSTSGTTCTSCNTGFYLNGNACSFCNNNCASCSVSAGNCITCVDSIHMTDPPQCACPVNSLLTAEGCVCNTGYYYTSARTCGACTPPCSTCTTSATTCTSCKSGYYLNVVSCYICEINCASCSGSANNCLTCVDSVHMTAPPQCACPANSFLTAWSCVCNTGYYYTSNLTCGACTPPCSTCSISATTCTSCNSGYYLIGSVCHECASPCLTCNNSETSCTSCQDSTHMTLSENTCDCMDPNSSFSTQSLTCKCNPGYFGMPNTCTACGSNCETCSNSASNCQTCIDLIHMSAAPECSCPSNSSLYDGTCFCDDGYYYSSNTVCSSCESPCIMCSGSSTFCTFCEDPDHMILNAGNCECADPNSSFNVTSGECVCKDPNSNNNNSIDCVCNPGYFEINGVCKSCSNFNMTWNNLNGTCMCIDPNASFNPDVLQCQCNSGYFNIGGICTNCTAPCLTCTTSPYDCSSCIDAANMTLDNGTCTCADPNASFSQASNTCECNSGYYSYEGVCTFCNASCAQCSSNGFCTACYDNMYLNTYTGTCRCFDPYAYFNQTSKACACIQGYYISNLGICQACISPCADCSDLASFCTACDDSANMNLNITTGACACKDSSAQFNPWVKACQSNPGCNCNQCGSTINNIVNNFNF